MSTGQALRNNRAAAADLSGPAMGARGSNTSAGGPLRRRPDSPADRLDRLSDRLDRLIGDVRLGATSHRQHDAHVDEAEAIAAELRAVFRAPTIAAHPPLRQVGGRAVW